MSDVFGMRVVVLLLVVTLSRPLRISIKDLLVEIHWNIQQLTVARIPFEFSKASKMSL